MTSTEPVPLCGPTTPRVDAYIPIDVRVPAWPQSISHVCYRGVSSLYFISTSSALLVCSSARSVVGVWSVWGRWFMDGCGRSVRGLDRQPRVPREIAVYIHTYIHTNECVLSRRGMAQKAAVCISCGKRKTDTSKYRYMIHVMIITRHFRTFFVLCCTRFFAVENAVQLS